MLMGSRLKPHTLRKGNILAPKSDSASWLGAMTKVWRNLDFSLVLEKNPKSSFNSEFKLFTSNKPENNFACKNKNHPTPIPSLTHLVW